MDRSVPAGARAGKSQQRYGDPVHDPYKSTRKSAGYISCPECQAVCHEGRWRWPSQLDEAETAALAKATEELCPACQRIRDHYPGGMLELSGSFFSEHQGEVLNLVCNTEEREKHEHPLHRIISKTRQDDKLQIAFTDAHLARAVGEALQHAWKGELAMDYAEEQNFLRASWHR